MKKDGLIYSVIFIFIVSFVLVLLLSLSHNFTKKRIDDYSALTEKKSILSAFGFSGIADKNIISKYESTIKVIKNKDTILYSSVKDGTTCYAKKFSGSGLWGTITGVLVVNSDVTKIIGIEIISHNETPGLGARIEEKWFKDQFVNESIIDNKITIVQGSGKGDYDSSNGRIDAITGATLTTNFFEKIINNELLKLKKILGVVNG